MEVGQDRDRQAGAEAPLVVGQVMALLILVKMDQDNFLLIQVEMDQRRHRARGLGQL